MRIAMLGLGGVPTLVGGVERMVEEIGDRLAKRGHTVRVYCRNHYTESMNRWRGMEIVRLPSLNTKYTDTVSHTMLSTIHLIKHPVDIAHYHSLGPAIFSVLPRLRRMKTIVQVHGLEWTDKKWSKPARLLFKYAFEPMAIYFPNYTASDGKHWKNYLERIYHRAVEFIPNGVDPKPASSNELLESVGLKPRKYILYMGRLVPQKGCHFLIQAYRRLNTNYPLVFAGDSWHSDDYVSYLKELANADSRIRFIGFVRGTLWAQLLTYPFVMVFPSEAEGQSVGLLEAMGFGNCVIASDIPENLEAVLDSCLVFRSRDIDDLTTKLQMTFEHPEILDQYRKAAVERVRSGYSWENAADILERFYKRLIQEADD